MLIRRDVSVFSCKTLIQDRVDSKKGCTSPSPRSLALPGLHLEGEEIRRVQWDRNPQNLLPALQGIKQKRKWSSTRQGLSLVASSAEGKPCPFHPTAPLCQQPPPWSMACLHSMVSTRGAWHCLSSSLESELTSCSGRQKGHPFLCSGHSRYATSPPC